MPYIVLLPLNHALHCSLAPEPCPTLFPAPPWYGPWRNSRVAAALVGLIVHQYHRVVLRDPALQNTPFSHVHVTRTFSNTFVDKGKRNQQSVFLLLQRKSCNQYIFERFTSLVVQMSPLTWWVCKAQPKLTWWVYLEPSYPSLASSMGTSFSVTSTMLNVSSLKFRQICRT